MSGFFFNFGAHCSHSFSLLLLPALLDTAPIKYFFYKRAGGITLLPTDCLLISNNKIVVPSSNENGLSQTHTLAIFSRTHLFRHNALPLLSFVVNISSPQSEGPLWIGSALQFFVVFFFFLNKISNCFHPVFSWQQKLADL